jgi:hypothetical protein
MGAWVRLEARPARNEDAGVHPRGRVGGGSQQRGVLNTPGVLTPYQISLSVSLRGGSAGPALTGRRERECRLALSGLVAATRERGGGLTRWEFYEFLPDCLL